MESVKRKIRDLEETSEKLRKSDSNFIIDEVFDTTAPLYRQLVVSFAEEQAIEDAIYYLGEAVGKNVFDVEVYLKVSCQLFFRNGILQLASPVVAQARCSSPKQRMSSLLSNSPRPTLWVGNMAIKNREYS